MCVYNLHHSSKCQFFLRLPKVWNKQKNNEKIAKIYFVIPKKIYCSLTKLIYCLIYIELSWFVSLIASIFQYLILPIYYKNNTRKKNKKFFFTNYFLGSTGSNKKKRKISLFFVNTESIIFKIKETRMTKT